MWNEEPTEQDNHQQTALKIIGMKILKPQRPPIKLVASGKEQSSMSGIISDAMHKAHQLTIKAHAVPTEYVRKHIRTEKVKSINVGLVRDV